VSSYSIALFIHLCALFVAFATTGMLALALTRVRSAQDCGDALRWLALGKTAGIVFPIVILTLLASGAFMVRDSWTWETPWVDAGLAGVVFLGVVGDRLEGGRARKIAGLLAADPAAPIEGRTAEALHDPLWWSGVVANPCIAVAVAFDMVTKPGPVGAGTALAVALFVGAAAAVPLWRRRKPEPGPVQRVAA
jgi:hypothetical protein